MIGPRIRMVLRFAAWAIIGLAPLMLFFALIEASAANFAIMGFKWQFWFGTIWSSMLPVVHGGVLLALLSIDERMQGDRG